MKKFNLFTLLLLSGISNVVYATSFGEAEYICSSCNTKDNYLELTSTNQLEPSSLDNRPGEMARSATIGLLQQCKHCGLVSYDISEEICPQQNEIIKSSAYRDKLSSNSINEWSKKYQAYAYLLEECKKNDSEIANAYIKAAWAADDENEIQNAIEFRKKTISYLEKLDGIDNKMRLIDLYRRTSQFEKASQLINTITIDSTLENACMYTGIMEHQKELIEEKNTNDQRMLMPVYCLTEKNVDWAIDTYIDVIEILKKQNDLQKVEKIEHKVITLLEPRKTFLDQFTLTYLYYKTNQIEKAKVTEQKLRYPKKWDGFFNKKYGNWLFSDISDDIKNNALTKGTPFYELAKKMLDVRNKKMSTLEDTQESFDSIDNMTENDDIMNNDNFEESKKEHVFALAWKIQKRANYTIDNIPYSDDSFRAEEQGISIEEYLSKEKLPFDATMKKKTDTSCEISFQQNSNGNLSEEDRNLGITLEDIKKEIQKSKNVELTCTSDDKCLYEKVEEYEDGLV